MRQEDTHTVSREELATAGIGVDEDLVEILGEDVREGERYFRVENRTPESPEEAVAFVQRIFFFAPRRLWLRGEEYAVEPSGDGARVRRV